MAPDFSCEWPYTASAAAPIPAQRGRHELGPEPLAFACSGFVRAGVETELGDGT